METAGFINTIDDPFYNNTIIDIGSSKSIRKESIICDCLMDLLQIFNRDSLINHSGLQQHFLRVIQKHIGQNIAFYEKFKKQIDDIILHVYPISRVIPPFQFRFSFVADESITIDFRFDNDLIMYMDISLIQDEEDRYFSNCGLFKEDRQVWSHVGNLNEVVQNVLKRYRKEDDTTFLSDYYFNLEKTEKSNFSTSMAL